MRRQSLLLKSANFLDSINRKVGELVSWLTLAMAILTFAIVVFRYLFQMGWVWLQDSVIYMHAIVFLAGAGYTYLVNEHVRVDLLHQRFSLRGKAVVEIFGVLFFLLPFSVVLLYQSLPYVLSSWSVWEGSNDSGGLQAIFFLKSFLMVFSGLLILQGVAVILRSILVLRGSEGG